MKLIVLVLAVGCMLSFGSANNNAIAPRFVKPQAKFNRPQVTSDSDNSMCGCHEIVAKLKKVEANMLKLIQKLRIKHGVLYSELLDMKKHVRGVSWYVSQTSETGHTINEHMLDASISLSQIMHAIRDLTNNQQRLFTKTLLTESILTLEKRHGEYNRKTPQGEIVYTSCDDERITQSGIYLVQDAFAEPTKVVCVLDFQPGAYTVIQNRQEGSTDFYRGYSDYRAGFGEFDGGDFWLGLDRIHNMTSSGDYELFIQLEDFEKNVSFARYDNFAIGEGNDFYPITKLDGFSGPAGDSFGSLVGVLFSAYDLDVDNSESNCAVSNRGAWWYNDCGKSNLNGLYLKGLFGGTAGMFWETFRGANYSLKKSRMMVKRKQMVITTDATTTMSAESTSMSTTNGEGASASSVAGETVFTSSTPTWPTMPTDAEGASTTSASAMTSVAGESTSTSTMVSDNITMEPETTVMSDVTGSSSVSNEMAKQDKRKDMTALDGTEKMKLEE